MNTSTNTLTWPATGRWGGQVRAQTVDGPAKSGARPSTNTAEAAQPPTALLGPAAEPDALRPAASSPTPAPGVGEHPTLFELTASAHSPDHDPQTLVQNADLVVINSSGGKDSQAMLDYVAELVAVAGCSDRVLVIHNDLGTTDSGIPVEWPGTRELAAEQADHYGFRFVTTTREKGGLFQQARTERLKFPGPGLGRWCTSDQKTSQAMKVVTAECRAIKRSRGLKNLAGEPVNVLYCLGLRAEESSGRACKPTLEVDGSADSRLRRVHRWLPIQDWTEAQVWDRIKASGVRYHPAYDWGMSRLSCSLCVLASKPDLIRAARLRPDLAADYAALEIELEYRFRADMSMAEIIKWAEETA